METKIKTETVTKNTTVYIARDGKEFYNPYSCKDYEKELDKKEDLDALPEIKEMSGILPIDIEENVSVSYDSDRKKLMANWFDVQTEEDAQKIKEYYKRYYYDTLGELKLGVNCVCVEFYDTSVYSYVYEMSDCLDAIIKFCKAAGLSCRIQKDNEVIRET